MNHLSLKKELWKSKSALCVPPRMEKMMDAFFQRFGKDVLVYKTRTEYIDQL
jgi:hypothetical protein